MIDWDKDFEEFELSDILSQENDYHPIGNHSQGSTKFEALYHIVCIIAGSGVLQLPFALSQTGWIGFFLILSSALINCYTGKLIIKLLDKQKNLKTYSQIGEAAFGRKGKLLVDVFAYMMTAGVPCVYLILSGMNLKELFGLSVRIWIVLCTIVVMIPFLMYKTLKELSILSAFGVFATILVILSVVYFAITDPLVDTRHKWVDAGLVPTALSSIAFSFSGNFVYPEVRASMKNPNDFNKVLDLSMILIATMYIITAFFGYSAYGDQTLSPILHNLPKGFGSKFAIAIITLHVLIACPILLTSFAVEMERRLQIEDHPNETKRRLLFRLIVVFTVMLVSLMMPYMGDFMTLLGAVSSTLLMFVFPVIFDWKLFGFFKDNFSRRSTKDLVIGCLIVLLGLYIGIVGGFMALKGLIDDVRKGNGGTVGA